MNVLNTEMRTKCGEEYVRYPDVVLPPCGRVAKHHIVPRKYVKLLVVKNKIKRRKAVSLTDMDGHVETGFRRTWLIMQRNALFSLFLCVYYRQYARVICIAFRSNKPISKYQ